MSCFILSLTEIREKLYEKTANFRTTLNKDSAAATATATRDNVRPKAERLRNWKFLTRRTEAVFLAVKTLSNCVQLAGQHWCTATTAIARKQELWQTGDSQTK